PARNEHDPAYGRTLSLRTQVGLTVQYNSPPVLTGRSNAGFPCDESAPFPALGSFADTLQAQVADADPDDQRFSYEFAVFPADTPDARTVLTVEGFAVGTVHIPAGVLVDGRTYSWQVRAGDGADTTPWSGVCSFVYDQTPPAAPTVTSPNYPPANSGQVPLGEPGTFTFTAGDSDTLGFQYGWESLPVPTCEFQQFGRLVCPDPFSVPGTVRADRPGGTATVTLMPPRIGPNTLLVRSIDPAGLRSTETAYEIRVPFGGEPTITLVGAEPRWGQPITLRFAPNPRISGTTGYEYRINSGTAQTVASGPDGTATITFTLTNTGSNDVRVRSRSANGWTSPAASWQVFFPPWPGVTSDIYLDNGEPAGGVGVTGTFTFTPPAGWTEIRGYEYSFDPFEPPLFVPAGPDGTATVTWTPTQSGFVNLDVRGVRPDGTVDDDTNFYSFQVA
ncbi:MAG TPA: hypothetical protein VFO68_17050, partial [Actinophytocola sp.]|nr:hypothetical protein [Actinophytocola sp.]